MILISACSTTKKAQRKVRKAHKLLEQAKVEAPEIFDTLYIIKTDSVIMTKDSLVTKLKLVPDTARMDSLLASYAALYESTSEAAKSTREVIRNRIIEAVLPDTNIVKRDSLKILVQGENRYVMFETEVNLLSGEIEVTTSPMGNVTFTSEKAVIEIEANRRHFWQDWKFYLLLVLTGTLWFFKEIIITWIKAVF